MGYLLRRTLRENGFDVFYQPMYSVKNGNYAEAEALLRLKDPRGYISPEAVIPVAEETGLICEIGEAVLRKVCRHIRSLISREVKVESISVNLSVGQLMRRDAAERLLNIIRSEKIPAECITFEITESVLAGNYETVVQKILTMSRAGIRFALDDFGTGFSNLSRVVGLPFSVVKLDKSLIWNSVTNGKCGTVIHDLTKTFHHINLLVTAEGVETTAHDSFVRDCGCDSIQGFLYARPMPVSTAEGYFAACVQ